MVFGYIRVSTDRQTVENQRYEINEFVKREGLRIDSWIEETISGTKSVEERKQGGLLRKMQKDDVLICAELSRLGRNLLMIMGLLNQCMKQEVHVWTIKDNYRLGSDISSKVLAFAFGLSAEIERNLISQRTKEALARKRAEGKILGRPVGSRSKTRKLTGKEDVINKLLEQNKSISLIARKLKVHRLTVATFIKEFLIKKEIALKDNTVYVDGRIFLRYKSAVVLGEDNQALSRHLLVKDEKPEQKCLLEKVEKIFCGNEILTIPQMLLILRIKEKSML